MTTLEWKHAGPPRPASMEVPDISVGNYDYTLVFDEKRKKTVYLYAKDYGGVLEAWTFDGAAWAPSPGETTRLSGTSSERHSYFDPARGGVVVWSVEHDSELKRHVPVAVIADAKGVRALETTGEAPLIEPADEKSFYLSSNIPLTVTFDRARNVAVCLTRRGIWELDAKGAWKKCAEGDGVIPPAWHSDAGGVFDPVRKACFFWVQARGDGYRHVFLGWDGETVTRLAKTGLPEKLVISTNHPCVDFVSHPRHGVVAFVGGEGLFAFDGARWTELAKTKNVPPRASETHFTYDDTRDLYVQGPGKHEGRSGGSDAQRVFYVLRNGAWEEEGALVHATILESMSGAMHAAVGPSWHVVNRALRTVAWENEAWRELVDEKTGEALCPKNERVHGITVTPAGLVGVTGHGSVLAFDGATKTWNVTAKRSPLWKDRSDFTLGYDEGTSTLVAWGGEVKDRKTNDTFFFDGKKWTQAKAPSPPPKDLKMKDAFVDYTMIYDHALGCLVRFGFAEVAVLEGDVWRAFTPKKYRELVGSRAWQHLPAYDRATGETLLVDFEARRVVRFDLAECKEVATFVFPTKLAEAAERDHEQVWAWLHDLLVYVPETRSLETAYAKDAAERYTMSLAPAFEAAKSLGARKLLGAAKTSESAPTASRLYLVDKKASKFWFCTVTGKSVARAWGKIGEKGEAKKESFASPEAATTAAEKLIAAKKREKYAGAEALSLTALEALGTRRSASLSVGGKVKSIPKHAVSRVGGLPSGVSLATWPKCGREPMGFLFQLMTGSHLKKHAGLSVFCTTDGSATEDEEGSEGMNRVVLLTAADLRKAPPPALPPDVPLLPQRLITVEAERPEINEGLVEGLADRDPAMSAAFDRFQAKAKVQKPVYSRVGGAPLWLQEDATPRKYPRFVAQLDFDTLSLGGAWEEAGLMGAVFVFASDDETKAIAFWQYT